MTRLTKENFSYIVGNCLHDSISFLIPDWNGREKDLWISDIKWAKKEFQKFESEWIKKLVEAFGRSVEDCETTDGNATFRENLNHIENIDVYAAPFDLYMLSNILNVGIIIYSATSKNVSGNFILNTTFSEGFESVVNVFYNADVLHYEQIIKL